MNGIEGVSVFHVVFKRVPLETMNQLKVAPKIDDAVVVLMMMMIMVISRYDCACGEPRSNERNQNSDNE